LIVRFFRVSGGSSAKDGDGPNASALDSGSESLDGDSVTTAPARHSLDTPSPPPLTSGVGQVNHPLNMTNTLPNNNHPVINSFNNSRCC
jgi:hypothetical protein